MKLNINKTYFIGFLWMAFIALFSSCTENDELRVVKYPEPFVEDFSPKTGRPGTEVTITGSDFGDYQPAATIFFNGVEVQEIVSYSDTEIKVKVPENASSGPVTIKVWTHLKVTVDEFNFIPGAKVSRIEPSQGIVGEELSIYGENFGSDSSQISVVFNGGIEAEIVSVTETKITVIVPEGGISGAILVEFGTQSLSTSSFSYPLVGLDFLFDMAGDSEGWVSNQNSTNEVSNGSFNVKFDASQFEGTNKRRADLQLQGGTEVHVGSFPILAIKINKPKNANFILDTNFGKYKNGQNNWDGILIGDVYYYDLRNSFGDGNVPSTTEITQFTTFQFKIADITSNEEGYSVDWIRSFESMDALRNFSALPRGKLIYEFDDPNLSNYWVGMQNATNIIEESKLKVTFDPIQFEGSSKRRADLKYIEGGTFPSGDETGLWRFSPDYPILAFKISFTGTGEPKPGTGGMKLDRFNGAQNNAYLTDFIDQNVIYYDLAIEGGFTEAQDLASFQLKIADITSSEETGYEVDWIRTFESKAELSAFLN